MTNDSKQVMYSLRIQGEAVEESVVGNSVESSRWEPR